ncbi:MAG TPA: YdcF family protein [Longimicrobiaceae bacterium]|nr:YdcF family protein [Longimicrobiaceae bacterium]
MREGRRRQLALLVLCALVLLGFGFRRSALVAVGDFLDVGEEAVPADLVYVLGGDIHTRPAAAGELYLAGYVPRIVMSRVVETQATSMGVVPNETEASRELLIRLGVPDSAIVILSPAGGVGNTAAEADQMREYLTGTHADHILVLTNDFHTRRARWNLRRKLGDVPVEVTMIGVSKGYLTAENWWRLEEGVILYFEEYLKFVHNFIYR